MTRSRSLPPLLNGLLVVLLMGLTWQGWSDAINDTGVSLFQFWKISEGQVLYRDFGTAFGPFSALLCGLLFRWFGVSLLLLALVNAVLVFFIAQMIFRIFERAGGRLSGLTASFCFLVGFAFAQYQLSANFNFITPYKFEVVHGTFLIVCLIGLQLRYQDTGARVPAFLLGLGLGATWLTCAEVALAAMVVVVIGLGLPLRVASGLRRLDRSSLGWFLGGCLVLPAAGVGYFSRFFPVPQAFHYVFSALIVPFERSHLQDNAFYRNVSGLSDWPGGLALLAKSVAFYAAAALALLALARATAGLRQRWRALPGLLLVSLFLLVEVPSTPVPLPVAWSWLYLRGLPVLAAVAGFGYGWSAWRGGADSRRALALALWSGFSFVLLLRIVLQVTLRHYGFYLAMPGVLLFVFLFNAELPAWLDRQGWNGLAARAFTGPLTFFFVLSCFAQVSWSAYRQKTIAVGTGGDRIWGLDPRRTPEDALIAVAADWLGANTQPSETVLALPDGLLLNYLTRRNPPPGQPTVSALGYLTLGEAAFLKPWREHPPDFVVLLQKDGSEHGLPDFGLRAEYGKVTMDWVRENYHRVRLFGAPPLRDGHVGVEILRRN